MTARAIAENRLRLLPNEVAAFQRMIWDFYRDYGREFAWRGISDPYAVLVSEMMLQQTQTARVVSKYDDWMRAFPTAQAVADAPLSAVLAHWSGLGYNRRAVFLQQACRAVCDRHGGIFPQTREELCALPGIGPYTAGAVATFAYNQPHVFIETNIRSVYIHTFFASNNNVDSAMLDDNAMRKGETRAFCGVAGATSACGAKSAAVLVFDSSATAETTAIFDAGGKIDDKDIAALVEQTLDRSRPREWYYALMDYGAALKKQTANPSRRSRQYAKQSRFEGSLRQARGAILRQLSRQPSATLAHIARCEGIDMERLIRAADKLLAERLVAVSGEWYRIAD